MRTRLLRGLIVGFLVLGLGWVPMPWTGATVAPAYAQFISDGAVELPGASVDGVDATWHTELIQPNIDTVNTYIYGFFTTADAAWHTELVEPEVDTVHTYVYDFFAVGVDVVWTRELIPPEAVSIPIASIAISPKAAAITIGETVSYTAIATDTHDTTFDVTGQTAFSIDAGAGGQWGSNTYTSEYAGEWTVTGTYKGLTDTATLAVLSGRSLPIPYYGQGNTKWCVPASMSMILKYYGHSIHLWEIAADWRLNTEQSLGGWTEYRKVKNYFNDQGLYPSDIDVDFGAVKDSIDDGKPVFLSMRTLNPWAMDHAVVVVGYLDEREQEKVLIHDPSGAFVNEKLNLPAPYIRVAVDWQDVEKYKGTRSYALSIDGSRSQANGTIDFFLRGPIRQLNFSHTLEHQCYSSYDPAEGLAWECSQPYPLVFGPDAKLILMVPITNHTANSQAYKFMMEFTETVHEFTFMRTLDDNMTVDGRSHSEPLYTMTLGDIVPEYGEYEVTLKLFDRDSGETYDTVVLPSIRYGPVVAPTADFAASPRSGFMAVRVSFTDQSSGDVRSWLWDFGNGYTSTKQNPSQLYTWGGPYTVKLTVSGPTGTHTVIKKDYIEVHTRIPSLRG